MIEKEQREVERRPITKITHKGEIEIENQNQEPLKAPDAMELEPEPAPKVPEEPEEKPVVVEAEPVKDTKDTTSLHKSHLFDLNCKICTGKRRSYCTGKRRSYCTGERHSYFTGKKQLYCIGKSLYS
ncbi:PHD finger protein 3-like [Engraulis encrasicolus]|uniref:PHD finger protein 3-like n=1 Tax=Engraulis encrasicolus TaxID=184585 RepID=UPI002FD09E0F